MRPHQRAIAADRDHATVLRAENDLGLPVAIEIDDGRARVHDTVIAQLGQRGRKPGLARRIIGYAGMVARRAVEHDRGESRRHRRGEESAGKATAMRRQNGGRRHECSFRYRDCFQTWSALPIRMFRFMHRSVACPARSG